MKFLLPLLLGFAFAGCDKVVFSSDPTPPPAPPAPPATVKPASPTPKPGAWMKDSKSTLDRSGKLSDKPKK